MKRKKEKTTREVMEEIKEILVSMGIPVEKLTADSLIFQEHDMQAIQSIEFLEKMEVRFNVELKLGSFDPFLRFCVFSRMIKELMRGKRHG